MTLKLPGGNERKTSAPLMATMVDVRCPNCSGTMEAGTVGAESITGGAKWLLKRTRLALGGEKIGDYRWDGMVWFDGVRCAKCRLLVLHY